MQIGIKVVFCVPKVIKPIVGAPEGRQRLRLRECKSGRLFVKTKTGIREFILEDMGDYWFVNPHLEQGRNERYAPRN